jgi:crotonobetainyl-CoA:carnitine CoA-transferase CaiB-like acyl-CoA transferase
MRSERMGVPTWKRGPMLGEHTEEVLKEYGYTEEQIKAMEAGNAAVQLDVSQYQHLDEE